MNAGPASERSIAVTVIVATHNRASRLRETLEALLAQKTPAGLGWEILIVDNGSTDATLEVFRTMAKQAPDRLRYAFEPRLGKSRALNAGIAAARGAVIALTDDDVSPADDWVATAATVLDQRGIDGAGGRILPRWEADPPSWLLGNPRLLDYLAIMDFDRPAMLPVPRGSYPQVWGRTWCTGAQRSRRWADSTRGSGRWATDATAERMWISSNGCFNPAARWHTTRR